MSNENQGAPRTGGLEPLPVNARIKISALWTAVMFVFAYVDLFSLYRADVRSDIEAGVISGFPIDQVFLLATTTYVAIPSLMIFATLVLRPRVNRVVNAVLGFAFALTIVVGAIGEWSYFVVGSAIEVALLAGIVYYAWTWPVAAGRIVPSAAETKAGARPAVEISSP